MANSSPQFDPPTWVWPTVVVALLTGQLVVCGVIVFASSSDPTVAVEPDYYEKAISWDQQAAQRERSRQLGWSATVTVDPLTDRTGARAVGINLRDRNSDSICGAAVRATVFHHACARERFETEFNETADGRYVARLPLKRDGVWEFRIQAQRGSDVFTLTREQPVGLLGSVAK
jgi:nitrogen fixation protein FixH